MTSFAIFVLGLIVTAIAGTGAVLIGLEEASDPAHSRFEDVTDLEKQVVGRGDEGAIGDRAGVIGDRA